MGTTVWRTVIRVKTRVRGTPTIPGSFSPHPNPLHFMVVCDARHVIQHRHSRRTLLRPPPRAGVLHPLAPRGIVGEGDALPLRAADGAQCLRKVFQGWARVDLCGGSWVDWSARGLASECEADLGVVWRLLHVSCVLPKTVGPLILLVWIVAAAVSIRALSPHATALKTSCDSFLLGRQRCGERPLRWRDSASLCIAPSAFLTPRCL
ncbi:hypothetical protein R3P38DRAFT_1049543 [Favolaschia claudopus]|uniref:Uncharacterized protein n=1 Tax=Favolaschia claudopus TaxID=2862362 RepID=A0AAW0BEU9_9AGAR